MEGLILDREDENMHISNEEWLDILKAGEIDEIEREKSRFLIINDTNAMDCAVYRLNKDQAEMEYLEVGSAKVLFLGKHTVPKDLDDDELEDYEGLDVNSMFDVLLEFNEDELKKTPIDIWDVVTVFPGNGLVLGYEVFDFSESESGLKCIIHRFRDVDSVPNLP